MGRFHRHDDGAVHDHLHAHERGGGRDVGDHGGYEGSTERVLVLERILAENDRVADENRRDLWARGIRTINLMSSPGAGKTTLLAATLRTLTDHMRIAILEGDIATSIDADALSGLGAQVALVNTEHGFGGECHLDAVMVRSGMSRLDLDAIDLLIIENVGNLVCPAEFDVGEDRKAMVFSVTEGEDKPRKYPVMFRACDVIVMNKIDLLPHLDFDSELFRSNLRAVNPRAAVIELSARTGEGIEQWFDWIRSA